MAEGTVDGIAVPDSKTTEVIERTEDGAEVLGECELLVVFPK